MTPIVGILLRNGITYKELATLCKQIYVQVAAQEFGIRGRDTNLSRIAILTGIDRREAGRIKDELKANDESDESQQGQDRMTRVLSGWHQDTDFLDAQGQPLILPLEGALPSFAQLARRYGGDMPATSLLKEFKRTGVVEAEATGHVRVLKRYYVPSQSDPGALLRAGSVINDLGSTLYHNLYQADSEKNKSLRFERRASNIQMPAESAELFRAFVEQEGQAFLEKIDAWLTEHELHADTGSAPESAPEKIRLGVGAYLIETHPSKK